VQFANRGTVLGTGLEFTNELQPDEDQTVRIGNMGGPADAVDTCEVPRSCGSRVTLRSSCLTPRQR
jgi:hypothetical protein